MLESANKKPTSKVQVFLLVFMVFLFFIAMGIIIFDKGKHFPTSLPGFIFIIVLIANELYKWTSNRKTRLQSSLSVLWYRQPELIRVVAWFMGLMLEGLFFVAPYTPLIVSIIGSCMFVGLFIYSYVLSYQEGKQLKSLKHVNNEKL